MISEKLDKECLQTLRIRLVIIFLAETFFKMIFLTVSIKEDLVLMTIFITKNLEVILFVKVIPKQQLLVRMANQSSLKKLKTRHQQLEKTENELKKIMNSISTQETVKKDIQK